MLSKSNAETLIPAFMTSILDYCNALLGGCSACLINNLQLVQILQLAFLLEPGGMTILARFCQHCTGSLLKHCLHFKILPITYKVLNGLAPHYFSDLLSHSLSHLLRSQNFCHLIIPRISKSTVAADPFPI